MPLALAHEAVGTLRHGVGVQCPAKGLFLYLRRMRCPGAAVVRRYFPQAPSYRNSGGGTPEVSAIFGGFQFRARAVETFARPMRGQDDKRSPGGSNMRGAVGAMDAGGAGVGGGKRGDACLAEIQRLEKNRANRRNRMEKARLVVFVYVCMCFFKGLWHRRIKA